MQQAGGGYKRAYEDKPMPPFTSQSQVYITASASAKNTGKWYYGYGGSWLGWVNPGSLGEYLNTLQTTDGKRYLFAPGFIPADVQSKLQMTPDTPMQPVQRTWNPTPQTTPTPQSTASTTLPAFPQILPIEPTKEFAKSLKDLNEKLDFIGRCLCDYNANQAVTNSLKRQKLNKSLNSAPLMHAVPGALQDCADEPTDEPDSE